MTCLTGGILQQSFVTPEVTYDTGLAWVATDAINHRSITIEPTLEKIPLDTHTGSPSSQGMVNGHRAGTWSMATTIAPAAVGVAPDIGELLKAAFGAETIVGGTSTTYVLNSACPLSLQLAETIGDEEGKVANGCWIETVTISVQANAVIEATFSGGFASFGKVSKSVVDAIAATAQATVVLAAASSGRITVGARIEFDETDNSGAGFLVTAVADDQVTLTVSPNIDVQVEADSEAIPLQVSQTLVGTPLTAVACDLSIGGESVNFVSGTVTLATGIAPGEPIANSDRPTILFRGRRAVTMEGVVYYDTAANRFDWLQQTDPAVTVAWILRIGPATAGSRATLNAPAAELDMTAADIPGSEALMKTFTATAHQSAAANDELTFAFD